MQQQKVIQVGNSLAVTLPKTFVEQTKIKAGKPIFVDIDPNSERVSYSTSEANQSSLTPEFKQWLDNVTSTYEDAIKELAKR